MPVQLPCRIQYQVRLKGGYLTIIGFGFRMIAIIIKAKAWVICWNQRLRWITQTEALIIIAIMWMLNPIIISLCIFLSCSWVVKTIKVHKTIVCRYDVTSMYIKCILCRYDLREWIIVVVNVLNLLLSNGIFFEVLTANA